jgi:ABC-2 type transport system ATP-binding protein
LDEPTNALDRAGIQEVRNLIRELPSKCGATVFVSSHLSAEVEQVATHLAIVAKGQLKFEGAIAELRARRTPSLLIEVDLPEQAALLLERAGIAIAMEGDRLRVLPNGSLGPAQINSLLVRGGTCCSATRYGTPNVGTNTFFGLTEEDWRAQKAAPRA